MWIGIMNSKSNKRNRRPSTDRKFSKIIAAAAKVFSKTGFEKASIRMVAARARVSLAGIYYHVQSKDELLFLIQYNAFQSIVTELKEKQAALPDGDPVGRLRVLIGNHFDFFLTRIDDLKVCSRELETLTGVFYRRIAEVRREYFKIALDIVTDISGKGKGKGKGKGVDPRTATLCLFGMLNWVYTWYDPAKDTSESLCRQFLELYLGGVGPWPGKK
jgi:TetR/AcrR family transcriptional regulator, cholesterol catabolism regulator